MPERPYTNKRGFFKTLFEGAIVSHFRRINASKEWHLLSKWRGVLNLLAFRIELRERNLHDTDGDLTKEKGDCPSTPIRLLKQCGLPAAPRTTFGILRWDVEAVG